MSDYTPSIAEIRREATYQYEVSGDGGISYAEFDAWLTDHDDRVRAAVARELLEIMDRPTTWSESTRLPKLLRKFDGIRAWANRIAEKS